MNERWWDPTKMGPRTRAATTVIVAALEPVAFASRADVRTMVLLRADIQPKTFDTLLSDLANFGLIVRLGTKHDELRLTTLGRKWFAENPVNRTPDPKETAT